MDPQQARRCGVCAGCCAQGQCWSRQAQRGSCLSFLEGVLDGPLRTNRGYERCSIEKPMVRLPGTPLRAQCWLAELIRQSQSPGPLEQSGLQPGMGVVLLDTPKGAVLRKGGGGGRHLPCQTERRLLQGPLQALPACRAS